MERNKKLVLLLGFGLNLFLQVPASADTETLWRLIAAGEHQDSLSAIDLPPQLASSQAVSIDAGLLSRLREGDNLVLELGQDEPVSYAIDRRREYQNGDTGWHGGFSADGDLFSIALTHGAGVILATIYSPEGKFSLRALPDQNDPAVYRGWVYALSPDLKYLAPDAGGYQRRQALRSDALVEYHALGSNDVSVVQTLTPATARVGQEVSVSIQITNNLSTTIDNEPVNILFTPDVSDLVSSSSGCTLGSTGSQAAFQCTLSGLAAGATTTIDYVIRLRDEAYPQVDNGVFIGDLFGETVRSDEFIFVIKDTLTDSDGDGISDFNEALSNTDPNNGASVVASDFKSEVDLLFLYTQKFIDDLGHPFPETEINQMVETTNGYYADSGANVEFRPVYYGFVDYTVNGNLNATMDVLGTASDPAFSLVPGLRDELGADIVILVDGLFAGGGLCGLGTTGAVGFEGEFYHPLLSNGDLYVTLFKDGFPPGGGSGCDDLTLAHELGHNFGLAHSRRDSSATGTFDWSYGHGVDGEFFTIMARESDYSSATSLALFSNPDRSNCNGLRCGVPRDQADGADAVHTLNHSRFQIAGRRQPRLISTATVTGDSTNLIMFGGATRNGGTELRSSFSSGDNIDVRATLAIPREHQGATGVTYVVVVVDGLGLFFRDDQGGYQVWDGSLETLSGTIVPRALGATEEVIAFSDFVPANIGVDSAALTVFFAYAVEGTDVFVYSASGVPVAISP